MTTQPIPPLAANTEALARLLPLAQKLAASRRGLILAPFLAALPASLLTDPARAIDPNETQVTLPDQYQWKPGLPGAPARSVETVLAFGATDKPGLYVVLIKWHPGYMSAPHTCVTDRLCFVLSGTWWVKFGRKVRARRYRASAGRRLRAPRRPHAALRRGQKRRGGARDHRRFRRGPDRL
ncbi:MAG: hypothetical protein P4L80_05495 [Xanthobacteraceae bacterium]|nr:hypothetical protein [Xanthobacteraceae bacterium]